MVDYRYDRKSNQSGPPVVISIPIVYIVVLFVDVIFCLHYICILLLLKGKDPDLIYLCRLVTPIEKKEPITPDMLLKLYNSVFKENNLMSQRIISSCLIAFAEFLRVSDFRILLYVDLSSYK